MIEIFILDKWQVGKGLGCEDKKTISSNVGASLLSVLKNFGRVNKVGIGKKLTFFHLYMAEKIF